jgi:hypothetical protein
MRPSLLVLNLVLWLPAAACSQKGASMPRPDPLPSAPAHAAPAAARLERATFALG